MHDMQQCAHHTAFSIHLKLRLVCIDCVITDDTCIEGTEKMIGACMVEKTREGETSERGAASHGVVLGQAGLLIWSRSEGRRNKPAELVLRCRG